MNIFEGVRFCVCTIRDWTVVVFVSPMSSYQLRVFIVNTFHLISCDEHCVYDANTATQRCRSHAMFGLLEVKFGEDTFDDESMIRTINIRTKQTTMTLH